MNYNYKTTQSLILFILIIVIQNSSSNSQEKQLFAKLELIDLDLEDNCEEASASLKNFLLDRPNSFQERARIVEKHGQYLRNQSASLKQLFEHEDDYPSEISRNLTLLIKNGDSLLSTNDYRDLIRFHINNEDLVHKSQVPCWKDGENCKLKKQDVKKILAKSRNATELEQTFTNWEKIYLKNEEQFSDILNLTEKAALANGYYTVKEYWEKMTEVDDAYEKAKTLWENIEPLYKKLYDFVLLRLNKYYGTNFTEIPVYLLGSNYGEDWSNIADIVSPRPQFLYDINVELGGLNSPLLYKLGENLTKSMGLGKLGKEFWARSIFNYSECSPYVLSYCPHKYSEVLSCLAPTWENYLNIHEASMEVVINNQDYSSLPRLKLRYSTFDEAVKSLGSIIAIANLPYNGILLPEVFKEEEDKTTTNKISALLLAALRVLPQLSYYYTADLWRLEELETPSENITAAWWQMRQKYQGIEIPETLYPDYLGDSYITLNEPYLSKFFGLIMQFDLLSSHQVSLFEEGYYIPQMIKSDTTLKTAIHDRPNMDVLSYHYGIDDVDSYNILNYFSPLSDYLDSSPPVDQEPIVKHGRRFVPTPKPKPKPKPKVTRMDNVASSVAPSVSEKTLQKEEPKVTEAPVKKTVVEEVPMASQKRNSYIFIGVACGFIALTILYGIISKCRKKLRSKRRTNRRFET